MTSEEFKKQVPCIFSGRFGRLGMTLYLGARFCLYKGQSLFLYIFFEQRPSFFFAGDPPTIVESVDWLGSK